MMRSSNIPCIRKNATWKKCLRCKGDIRTQTAVYCMTCRSYINDRKKKDEKKLQKQLQKNLQ